MPLYERSFDVNSSFFKNACLTSGTRRIRVCPTCRDSRRREAFEPSANYGDERLSSEEIQWARCLIETLRASITVSCVCCYLF